MSKKHNTVENNSEVVEPVIVPEVSTMTYEDALALVPAKEHRSFTEQEFNVAALLKLPTDKESLATTLKGLSHGAVYAFCVIVGKAGCDKIANICLEDASALKPSAVASFKSVVKGMTTLFAGKTAYGLLSMVKSS